MKGDNLMTDKDNRVLSRRGARIVNEQEASRVNGGVHTETVCTFSPVAGPDGDFRIGEC